MKSTKPGGGGRFQELASKLARKGVKNPDAVAAAAGRAKWGAEKMAHWSAKGRERASS